MTGCYGPRFDEAVLLAVDAFRDVRRKSSDTPYVTHLFAVCAKVGEHGGDEDQMIAALLHDYLEDVEGATVDALRERFGERVADLVVALSDSVGVREKAPWKGRKEVYIASIRAKGGDVRLISAADKWHNCMSTCAAVRREGLSAFDVFRGGLSGTLWYYGAMVEALETGWSHPMLDELRRAVDELNELVASQRRDA